MSVSKDQLWTLPIRFEEVGQGRSRSLVADEATRARLAELLDLESLERLEAELELKPAPGVGIAVTGKLSARVEQICGLSLDPFFTDIDTEIDERFTAEPPETPAPGEELALADLDAPEFAEGGVIDLAALVIDHLALAIDPFPRKPGAVFEAPEPETEPSPFAALAALKRDKPA